MLSRLRAFVLAHKFISGAVLVVIIGGGWYWYSSTSTAAVVSKYVIQKATTGTVIASVSGSGQIQAQTTVDVKPQASENVTKIYVGVGDHVVAGQLLVQLDTTNEAKAVTQAQLSLQSSQISLAKLQEAAATTTLESDQDAVTQAQQTASQASTTLVDDYQSGFDSLASSFVNFQNLMLATKGFVQGNDLSRAQNDPDAYLSLLPSYLEPGAAPYRDDVQSTYEAAVAAYQANLADYHAADRNAASSTLDSLFSETANTAKTIGDATAAIKNYLNYIVDNYPSSSSTNPLPTITTTYQTNFGTDLNTVNNDITSITNTINQISSDESAITNDALSLGEKQSTLAALLAGPDPLDVQSQNLSISQSELSLQTAEANLADDSIRAPISGIVSAMPSVVGEAVPSPAASIIGDGDLAQVTLNEVDAAKVSVGDKATLTFDALPDLSVAGHVAEVDAVGTVSQGVVNYNVNVAIDGTASSTAQIKPGMSVTVNIVTQVDQNVVAVPNAAVKTSAGASYVLEPASPVSDADLASSASGGIELPQGTKMVPVTIGLADNTMTEITSGVNVGDQIVAQTIQSSGSSKAAAGASTGGTSAIRLLGGGGGGGGFGGGGGAVRVGGGG